MKRISAAVCAAALALACSAAAGCAPDGAAPHEEAADPAVSEAPAAPAAPGIGEAPPEAEPVHEHIWVSDYELETTEAVTETVHHDAVIEEVVEDHAVCNVCLEIVDGEVEAHQAATGHTGVSAGVPVTVERVVSDAWDEEVEKSPANAVLVSRTETCTQCGERREAEVKTVDAAAARPAADAPAQQ